MQTQTAYGNDTRSEVPTKQSGSNQYTAALPSHIQQAAYNSGAQAGAITEDASMKNATSVRAKAEQQSYDEWFKEHNTGVIAEKQEIGERFLEAEANGDIAEMNEQRKEYQELEQWSKETIRDRKAQIGKAIGGVVKLGGEKVDVQATDIGANATDIGANATDIGKTAYRVKAAPSIATYVPHAKKDGNYVNVGVGNALAKLRKRAIITEPELAQTKESKYKKLYELDTPQQRYEYLLDQVNNMDVTTERDQAIFYAGRVVTKKGTITARQIAEKYVVNIAKKGIVKFTLERTPGGKWLDDLKLYNKSLKGQTTFEKLGLTKEQTNKLWSILSSRYAEGASGVVIAFAKNVPDIWKPKTVFWSTELPLLEKNKNVTQIDIR